MKSAPPVFLFALKGFGVACIGVVVGLIGSAIGQLWVYRFGEGLILTGVIMAVIAQYVVKKRNRFDS